MKKILLSFMIFSLAHANDLPGEKAIKGDQVISNFGEKKDFLPGDQVLSDLSKQNTEIALKKMGIKDKELINSIIESQKKIETIKNGSTVKEDAETEKDGDYKKIDEVKVVRSSISKKKRFKSKMMPKTTYQQRSSIRIFGNNQVTDLYQSITLPSGSKALATLMTGVEVATEKREIDIKVSYAFLGPNGAVVDLTDCLSWVTVWGSYNTERIYGAVKKISCRAPNGKTFEIPINGQIRDGEEEYVGIKAKLVTRGKIAAAALSFLQQGTQQFGKAIAAAQVRTDVVAGGTNSAAAKGQNVFGSQSKYILGKSIAGATGGFLDWWINYYKSLSPTLAIPPGKKIFLAIKGEVQIPKIFFKKPEKSENKEMIRLNTGETLTLHGEKE